MSYIPDELRQQVRQRAGQRCEYCRQPEGFSGRGHQIDHIIPQKHEGPSTIDNLAWSCFQCNIMKGSEVAAYDVETGELVSFFNPRTQRWDDHFVMENASIIGRSPTGGVTIQVFGFNHPDRLEARTMLIEAGVW